MRLRIESPLHAASINQIITNVLKTSDIELFQVIKLNASASKDRDVMLEYLMKSIVVKMEIPCVPIANSTSIEARISLIRKFLL